MTNIFLLSGPDVTLAFLDLIDLYHFAKSKWPTEAKSMTQFYEIDEALRRSQEAFLHDGIRIQQFPLIRPTHPLKN